MERAEGRAASDARLRAVMDATRSGIVILDLEGNILESNAAFSDIMGYDSGELEGMAFRDLLAANDVARAERMLDSLRSGDAMRTEGERKLMRRDKIILSARAVGTLVQDKEGDPREMILLLEDVSETVQLPHRMD